MAASTIRRLTRPSLRRAHDHVGEAGSGDDVDSAAAVAAPWLVRSEGAADGERACRDAASSGRAPPLSQSGRRRARERARNSADDVPPPSQARRSPVDHEARRRNTGTDEHRDDDGPLEELRQMIGQACDASEQVLPVHRDRPRTSCVAVTSTLSYRPLADRLLPCAEGHRAQRLTRHTGLRGRSRVAGDLLDARVPGGGGGPSAQSDKGRSDHGAPKASLNWQAPGTCGNRRRMHLRASAFGLQKQGTRKLANSPGAGGRGAIPG